MACVGYYQFRPIFGKNQHNLNKIINALQNVFPRQILDAPALVRDWDEAYVRKTVEAVERALSDAKAR